VIRDWTKNMNKTIYVLLVMMAGLATVAGTDIFLPSLPSMAVYFAASEDAIRLSIPVYLTGSLCAAPILGALSDRLGRRRVLLMGLGVFLLGTAICLVSPSIHIFFVGRFIQGSGAIVSPVVGWAILQDLYTGERGAKIMAWAGSIVSVGPFVAPGLGGTSTWPMDGRGILSSFFYLPRWLLY